MYDFPKTQKKPAGRIASYRSALLKEKRKFGHVNDGAGKRYLLFSLYFVLNDLDETADYIAWYDEEFSDDVGEPIQKFCRALSLRRINHEAAARKMLGEAMLSNLYLIPRVIGREVAEHDIWHSSSDHHISYVSYLPDEAIAAITETEMQWLSQEYDSPEFRQIRDRYLVIFRLLKDTRELDERARLLDESCSLTDALQ